MDTPGRQNTQSKAFGFRAHSLTLTTLFAVAGVYLGLWIPRTEFNIRPRMGMTMTNGVVTEIAIISAPLFGPARAYCFTYAPVGLGSHEEEQ